MTTILKIVCVDETRRILLDDVPDFESLDTMIRRIYPDCCANMTKYTNRNGDYCPLAKACLSDFLASASKEGGDTGHRVLKLWVPVNQRLASREQSAEQVAPSLGSAVSVGAPSTSAADGTETESPRSESSWHRLDWECGSNTEATFDAASNEDEWVEAAVLGDDSVDMYANCACESASSGAATPAEETTLVSEELAASRIQRALLRYHHRQSVGIQNTLHDNGMQQQVEAAERASLILFAFDANGDEHLNFEEYNDLQKASWNGSMTAEVYRQLCSTFGEDVEIGLGAEALIGIYAELGTLDRDFAAARQRLEGVSPATVDTREAVPTARGDPSHWSFGMRVAPLSAAITALSAARGR